MNNILINNDFHYATESLLRVFFPNEKINNLYSSSQAAGDKNVFCEVHKTDNALQLIIRLNFGECKRELSRNIDTDSTVKEIELSLSRLLFEVLCEYTQYTPKWGIQTGVRPSKLLRNTIKKLGSAEMAREYLKNELKISPDRISLTEQVVKAQEKFIENNKKNDISIYISIPFCPTRCEYCSFISHSIEKAAKLLPDYSEKLIQEIERTGEIVRSNNLRVKTVYIGGGTPTTLAANQLQRLLLSVESAFDLTDTTEFTVEAGRPDTITKEKLAVIKNSAANRITINPQTFNDDVLKNIGRRHTSAQTVKAFKLAADMGFDNINTDLIAGLPGESLESFINSVKSAVALGAQNITLHTLALKRSSYLVTRDNLKNDLNAVTEQMIYNGNKILYDNDYAPYYMYRQSRSVGNLENVGWCKHGKECEYNIYMMEELHSIIGIGAGAVTRLKDPGSEHIERIYNYKYPYEYIDGFDEILLRKNLINDFISKYY